MIRRQNEHPPLAVGHVSLEDLEACPGAVAAYLASLEGKLEDVDAQVLSYEELARRDEERRMMWPVVFVLVGLALVGLLLAIAAWFG
jgi:hypothetical protein